MQYRRAVQSVGSRNEGEVMPNLSVLRGAVLLALASFSPVIAAGIGPVVITQSTALQGGISGACDAPGFPITICKQGSYILGSNLTVPANHDGIDIAVPGVTIDLNGFTVRGPVTCTGVGTTLSCSKTGLANGIAATGQFVTGNMTVRNGNVRGFGQLGVSLTGTGNVVDGINASENLASGIFVWFGAVSNSTSSRNMGAGFVCFAGQVRHATAYGNTFGMLLNRCTATDNSSTYNAQYGLSGFHSFISGNEFDDNGQGDLFNEVGLVSTGNNACSGVSC
jgi:hypothetical protein